MADKMTTQKTTFENKPYSALFINGPYESRNVQFDQCCIIYKFNHLFTCTHHPPLFSQNADSVERDHIDNNFVFITP